MAGLIVGDRYRLVRKIGSGSFGDVYIGFNINNAAEKVAVKLENRKKRCSRLLYESQFYSILQGGEGIPRMVWFGKDQEFNALVMDLLGSSLRDLLKRCSGRFSIKTTLMLADQMISRVEYVHKKNLVHRDIKPENFVMGIGHNSNKAYLIDFGLSKKYRNSPSHHICYREEKNLTGTVRYASINAHLGIEQSRRDDMEALGHVLLFFLRGKLPWQGLTAANRKQLHEKIGQKKMSTTVNHLCEGYPAEFAKYLTYCRRLKFEEDPNYGYLRHIFRMLFRTLNYQFDYMYDWKLRMSVGNPV